MPARCAHFWAGCCVHSVIGAAAPRHVCGRPQSLRIKYLAPGHLGAAHQLLLVRPLGGGPVLNGIRQPPTAVGLGLGKPALLKTLQHLGFQVPPLTHKFLHHHSPWVSGPTTHAQVFVARRRGTALFQEKNGPQAPSPNLGHLSAAAHAQAQGRDSCSIDSLALIPLLQDLCATKSVGCHVCDAVVRKG